MARYWVVGPVAPDYFSESSDPNPTTYRIQFRAMFMGADVPGTSHMAEYPFEVEPLFTDTPATIATKVVNQVVALAASKGLTVARGDGLLPTFTRGS
jgi:hypothetical protein